MLILKCQTLEMINIIQTQTWVCLFIGHIIKSQLMIPDKVVKVNSFQCRGGLRGKHCLLPCTGFLYYADTNQALKGNGHMMKSHLIVPGKVVKVYSLPCKGKHCRLPNAGFIKYAVTVWPRKQIRHTIKSHLVVLGEVVMVNSLKCKGGLKGRNCLIYKQLC